MIELRRRYSGGVQSPSFSRLPKGYQEVEYLESTGTQYIITDIPANDGTDITIDFQLKKVDQPYRVVFGARSIVPERWYLYIQNSTQWNFGHGVGKMVDISTGGDRHIVNYITSNDKRVEIDGVRVKSFTSQVQTGLGIYIFYANNPANEQMFPCEAKIFSFKAKDAIANKDYHLIPCYDKKTLIAGMYDIVNDVFYTNAGTGEFLVGMDIVYDSIPTFDYMLFYEAGGCFDTGYIPNERTSIEMEFALTEKINDILIAGCVGASPWDLRFGIWTFQQGVQAAKTSTSSAYTLVHFSKFLETDKLKVVVKNSISYIYINDILYDQVGYYTEQKFNSFRTIYIGTMNNGASAAGLFVGKMYSFKILENENLIHDYRAYEDNKIIDIKTGEIVENIGQKPAYAREELMNNDIIG